MDSVSNVSSQEELLELRNDGKISESEYEELLEALQKGPKAAASSAPECGPARARTSGLAIVSLVCSLLGPLCWLPAVVCGHVALHKIHRDPALTGRGIALAGLIIGYLMLGFSILLLGLWGTYTERGVEPDETVEMTEQVTELRRFPLDNLDGVITQSGVRIDTEVSSDGNGSLRIDATEPVTVCLFETGDIDVEYVMLFYRAQLRTADIEGQVYLEMLCAFSGRGEFFSRGLAHPLSGTMEWTTRHTHFFLKEGENPDNIKLNVVVNGKGTVWIDDIRLTRGPLH